MKYLLIFKEQNFEEGLEECSSYLVIVKLLFDCLYEYFEKCPLFSGNKKKYFYMFIFFRSFIERIIRFT